MGGFDNKNDIFTKLTEGEDIGTETGTRTPTAVGAAAAGARDVAAEDAGGTREQATTCEAGGT